MTDNVEQSLQALVKDFSTELVKFIMTRLDVPSTADPSEVTNELGTKLAKVISDYVMASFQEYDGTLADYLQDAFSDTELGQKLIEEYLTSAFSVRGAEILFKKNIYSLQDNVIYSRIDATNEDAENVTDINTKKCFDSMENLTPKKVTLVENESYKDRPLVENRIIQADFTTLEIPIVTGTLGAVYARYREWIPIIVAAFKQCVKYMKKYDEIIGFQRNEETGEIDLSVYPAKSIRKYVNEHDTVIGLQRNSETGEADMTVFPAGSMRNDIKLLQNYIGTYTNENTIADRLDSLETQVKSLKTLVANMISSLSSLQNSVSSLNSSLVSLSSSVSSLESDVSSIQSDISSINSDISSLESRVSALESAGSGSETE